MSTRNSTEEFKGACLAQQASHRGSREPFDIGFAELLREILLGHEPAEETLTKREEHLGLLRKFSAVLGTGVVGKQLVHGVEKS